MNNFYVMCWFDHGLERIQLMKGMKKELRIGNYIEGEEQTSEFHQTPRSSKETLLKSLSTIQSSNHRKEKENFQSIKRFKEEIIKEKNENTTIIRQNIFWPQNDNLPPIQSLDQVCTIESFNSSLSNYKLDQLSVEESIILMKGRDLKTEIPNFLFSSSKSHDLVPDNIPFRVLANTKLPLVLFPQIGFICHYRVDRDVENLQMLRAFILYNHQLILEIYFTGYLNSQAMVTFYEPYQETLIDYLKNVEQIEEIDIIEMIISVLKTAEFLKGELIFPELRMQDFVTSNGVLKLKMCLNHCKTLFKGNEKTLVKQSSAIGLEILKKLDSKLKLYKFHWFITLTNLLKEYQVSDKICLEFIELQLHMLQKHQ